MRVRRTSIGLLLGLVAAAGAARAVEIRRLALPTRDLLRDPVRDRLYAATPGTAGTLGNRVVVITPARVAIESSPLGAFVGSEPSRLAIDDAATVLYVALQGAPAVARVRLDAFRVDERITFGQSFLGPIVASDLAVSPGAPDVVAVALTAGGSSAGVAIYDRTTPRPDVTPSFTSPTSIEFSRDGTTLYGAGSFNGFQLLQVTPTGVQPMPGSPAQGVSVTGDIEFDGELIVTTDGQAITTNGALAGTYSVSSSGNFVTPARGPVASDRAHDRVYYVTRSFSSGSSAWMLLTYHRSQFTLLDALPLPTVTGEARTLVRWGADGLALGTDDGGVYLIASSFEPCVGAAQCDDGDACTTDRCREGACVHDPVSCGDDECSSGVCDPQRGCLPSFRFGQACHDDGDPCTTDTCGATGCEHRIQLGLACADDGDPCTNDACGADGTCRHDPEAGLECADDGDACTADLCSEIGTCLHTPVPNGETLWLICHLLNANRVTRPLPLCTGNCPGQLQDRLTDLGRRIVVALQSSTRCRSGLTLAAARARALARTVARLTQAKRIRPASQGHQLAAELRATARRVQQAPALYCPRSPGGIGVE